MNRWYDQVYDLTCRLVRWPSITNSPDETAFARHLSDLLAAWPYFQAHPDQLRLERTANDVHDRSVLFALVRGDGPATVVLTGHYDVVAIANYGQLAPWAYDPEALLPRLIADLEARRRSEADDLALRDLKSGAYLPGRGALDMKSGLAIGLAVLKQYATSESRRGNVLFVAVPDEEEASHGMRSAALRLPEIAREWRLDLQMAINLDSAGDRGDGDEGRAIFLGSVGKLLPSVLVVGRETHAGSPFDGVNANVLAAEISRRIECNVALSDTFEGAVSPPPVNLKQADSKTHYDVTTPTTTWCYYNVLTYRRGAGDVLRDITEIVREGLDAALQTLHDRARQYSALVGRPADFPDWQPVVLTFAELRERVLAQSGVAAERAIDELTEQLAYDSSLDLPELSRRLTAAWWARSGLSGPAAVVGFGSLYYPPSYVSADGARQRRVRAIAIEQAATLSAETAIPIKIRPFFPGISDMSFLGSAVAPAESALVAANTPAWDARLRFDYQAIRALDLPTINVGPWGADYHQRTERVNMPYSFEIVPELVWRIVGSVLDQTTG